MASAATTSHNTQANRRNFTLNKPNLADANLYQNPAINNRLKPQQHQHHQQMHHRQQMDNSFLGIPNENQQHNTFYNTFKHSNAHMASSNNFLKSNLLPKAERMLHHRRMVSNDDIKFTLNNLIWAKLDNFPWWPCKIVQDSNNEFTKIIGQKQMYFIEFFGPQVERAWLSQDCIFRYKGIESFKIYAQDQVDRAISKSVKEKLAERFQLKVALNRRDQWEQAIEQADLYLKKQESIHDINTGRSKSRLADSLAKLNQINEEKMINSTNLATSKKKTKYTKKNSQEEFISGYDLQKQFQIDSQNSQKTKKQKKMQQRNDNEFQQNNSNLDIYQHFNSIESMRQELKPNDYSFTNQFTEFNCNNNEQQTQSNVSANNRNLLRRKLADNENEEATADLNESDSQNSSLSSDEDNDSLFQPTSIFEYDTEQPIHNQIDKNNIQENENFYKNNYYQVATPGQEYNLIHNFAATDSDEEEKIDKNDTEWSNTSLKSTKRKSTQKTTSKKAVKYSQKISSPDNGNKKHLDMKLQQTTLSPIKKKRGRKPKYSIDTATFPNDENKTFLQSQKQSMFNGLDNTDSANMYSKICSNSISSVNSSRRASDTSTLNTSSDDEIFHNNNHSEIDHSKQDNSVLMEDNSVLNQSEINKICKKNLKMKATALKKASQSKKRNSKSTSSNSGSITGTGEFNTYEQIGQITELDYNQFVDENTGIQNQNSATSAAAAAPEQNQTSQNTSSAETYLIDRYKYAVRHIRQGLSVEEACNKYRISKGALLKCLSGGTAPRGKKTRLTESEENEIVEWLINHKDLKYNEAIHLVFEQVEKIFLLAQRPNPFNNGKPSMDWWYDFLSRHPQIMASKPDWLMRGKVNDQYIKDVQSGQLKCTKFRRALLSAIQYIRSLNDAQTLASSTTYREIPDKAATSQTFKVAPGLSNRIEKNDNVQQRAASLRPSQKSSYYSKNNVLKHRKNSGYDDKLREHDAEEIDELEEEEVPSPTSLDTRIFNTDNNNNNNMLLANNLANNNSTFSFMNHQKITADSRPIKNEKSIQDSLEYLYEQNNNFINEISNINQLMDKNNNSVPNNSVSKGNSKPQFFMDGMNKQQQAVDSNFDTFLVDQALDSNQNNFGDLMESKIDTSSLSLNVTNPNMSVRNGSNILNEFVSNNDSGYVSQSFTSSKNNNNNVPSDQQTYFNSNYNQTSFFQKTDTKDELNPTMYLNNMENNNLLINSHDFNGFTQSGPFDTKLDFSQKNHLLIQDDDDDNDDDIELVNSILSNNSDNLDGSDIIGTSLDNHGFNLP